MRVFFRLDPPKLWFGFGFAEQATKTSQMEYPPKVVLGPPQNVESKEPKQICQATTHHTQYVCIFWGRAGYDVSA